MNVLIFGAGGKTGRLAVSQAVAAGHSVTAFVRDAIAEALPGTRIVAGDATNRADVDAAMKGQDAVIDTVGGKTPYKETTLESSIAAVIVASMKANGVHRLLATSMLGVGGSKDNAPMYARLLVATFLRGADKDKAAMEAEIEASGLDWTVLRPAILTDDDATGQVHILTEGSDERAHKISRADVATFAVEQLTSDAYLHQAITIATS